MRESAGPVATRTMARTRRYLGVVGAVIAISMPTWATEGPFVGVDVGASGPANNNYRAHVEAGATANPYAGYMFNRYLGLQGDLHFVFQYPDNDHRGFEGENQITSLFGATVGPRVSLPLSEKLEFFGVGQGGFFTGLSGRLGHTSGGVSAGGGFDYYVTPNIAVTVYGRWNRAFQAPRPITLLNPNQVENQQGPADAQWAVGGVGLKYSFNRPAAAPPPPPPPVAQAPPPPVKKKIVLRSVHFDFDKSTIRPDAVPVLNEAVEILKAEGGVAVIVAGYTDSVGTDAYNQKLSLRRADAVRKYLVEHGIPANRITTEGFGESHPVASNDTADGRAQNRRVELHVE
jgi:outer membrane protein OmpA-like peptidoglycan-associated protein